MKIDPLLFKKTTTAPSQPIPAPAVPAEKSTVPAQVPALKPTIKSLSVRPVALTKPAVTQPQPAQTQPQPQPQTLPAKVNVKIDSMLPTAPVLEAPAQGPVNFQDRLNELDRLITVGSGINMLNVDTIRGHIMQIMIDLKQQPELDSCLIDRDVHNVLKFVRHTHISAREDIESNVKKREVKVAKKKAGKVNVNFDLLDGPEAMFSNPMSLDELGDME